MKHRDLKMFTVLAIFVLTVADILHGSLMLIGGASSDIIAKTLAISNVLAIVLGFVVIRGTLLILNYFDRKEPK